MHLYIKCILLALIPGGESNKNVLKNCASNNFILPIENIHENYCRNWKVLRKKENALCLNLPFKINSKDIAQDVGK